MELPKENDMTIYPQNMSVFPYFIIGNVYFNKSSTIGILLGDNIVISGNIKGIRENLQVDFLPFTNGDIHIFNMIKGTIKAEIDGLLLIVLMEPIGKTLIKLLEKDTDQRMFGLNDEGLFNFLQIHIEKGQDMEELRLNGFLEDNLSLIGYMQNTNIPLYKKMTNQMSLASSYANANTLTSTFIGNGPLKRSSINSLDSFSKSNINYVFSNRRVKHKASDSKDYKYFEGDDGDILHETKGHLICSPDKVYAYYNTTNAFQSGTPLFIRETIGKNIVNYILFGFHLDNSQDSPNDSFLAFSQGDQRAKAKCSKGLILTSELYKKIVTTLSESYTLPNKETYNRISLAKSFVSPNYLIMNYYFYDTLITKGIVHKNLLSANLFKTLQDLFGIPLQFLQVSFDNNNYLSHREYNSNDKKKDTILDSFYESYVDEEHDQYIIDIFCKVDIDKYGEIISKNVMKRVKDKKKTKQYKEEFIKNLSIEIKPYEIMSSFFYGLLFHKVIKSSIV